MGAMGGHSLKLRSEPCQPWLVFSHANLQCDGGTLGKVAMSTIAPQQPSGKGAPSFPARTFRPGRRYRLFLFLQQTFL